MPISLTTKNSSSPSRTRRGFTIIELVIVSIVFALLAGSMIRVSMNTYKKMLTEKAARQLYLSARYARIFAIEKQQTCKLVISQEDSTFCLMGKLSKNAEETILANTYTKPVELEDDTIFESITITPTGGEETQDKQDNKVIVFRPDGTADAAVLQIGDGKNHYSISISAATGRAKVNDGIIGETPVDIIDLDQEL